MNEAGPIRIGIVGAGGNTKSRHIPGLRAIPGVEIIRVCNRTVASAKKVCDEFGIPEYTGNWREIVDDPRIDAVVIGTWPYMHCPVTVAALQNAKHVLCEARMAMNSNEAHRMLDAYRNAPGCVAMIVPSPFTLGIDAVIRRLLDTKSIGTLVSVEIRGLAPDFHVPDTPVHWREQREYSGNNMLTLGIWYEAVMRWLGEAKHVVAMGKIHTPMRTIPEHLDVVAEMHSGAQLHMQLSSIAHDPEGTYLAFYGTRGNIVYRNGELMMLETSGNSYRRIEPTDSERAGWRVEEEFIGAIRGNEPVRFTTFEDGVRYMEFTDAVYEGLRTGVSVALPY